jgi:hypothetical protein
MDTQPRAKRLKFFSVESVQWLAWRANPCNPCYRFVSIRAVRREFDRTAKRPYINHGPQGIAQ